MRVSQGDEALRRMLIHSEIERRRRRGVFGRGVAVTRDTMRIAGGDGLVWRHPYLGLHVGAGLGRRLASLLGVDRRHRVAEGIETVDRLLMVRRGAKRHAGRIMDHHDRAKGHGDVVAGHGDDRGGRSGDALDDHGDIAPVCRKGRIDRAALGRDATAAVDPHGDVCVAADFGKRHDHVGSVETVVPIEVADRAREHNRRPVNYDGHFEFPIAVRSSDRRSRMGPHAPVSRQRRSYGADRCRASARSHPHVCCRPRSRHRPVRRYSLAQIPSGSGSRGPTALLP